jgi:hypothetical protein
MDSQPLDAGSTWECEHNPSPGAQGVRTILVANLHIASPIDGASPVQSSRLHGRGSTSDPTGMRMAALRAAWVAHTVKRAIAAVSSASDQDYQAFGWERGELLAKLRWQRDGLGHTDTISLAVAISRPARRPRRAT